jgi:predicted lipoprotein
MECGPTDSAEVDSVALPPVSGTVPSEVAPSKNCAVPVAADGDTVAVKVTFCPAAEGLAFEDTEVAEAAWFTNCDSTFDALLKKLLSPL